MALSFGNSVINSFIRRFLIKLYDDIKIYEQTINTLKSLIYTNLSIKH